MKKVLTDGASIRYLVVGAALMFVASVAFGAGATTQEFDREIERVLPVKRIRTAAALTNPAARRATALKEVMIAEQLQRMLESYHAILEDEIARTERALLAATRDSRLGFQQESDYVYTPYSLTEKLKSMRETLAVDITCF